jgi:hypothetical protein
MREGRIGVAKVNKSSVASVPSIEKETWPPNRKPQRSRKKSNEVQHKN